MKKVISLILAIVMIFSIGSVAAYAAETYEVIFTEFPYDIAPFRSDYVGKYMGYEYGTDYWFTITNEDGTTTEIKGYPYSVEVKAGQALEFTVSVADHIEPSSVKVMAYPTGIETDPDFYNPVYGDPNPNYYLTRTIAGTYGVIPTAENPSITVCLSEFHMYNDAFLFDFPSSEFYTANRLHLVNPDATNEWDKYAYTELANTEVIYVNETLFFEVRIPLDGKYDYHYNSYHVYYKTDDFIGSEKIYLRMPASEKEGTAEIDERIAHYETDTEWVDIYAIPNVPSKTQVKVANTVTYTIAMLDQFFQDFDLENLDSIDLSTVDIQPILTLLLRILNLIIKILNSFGLNISLPDLFG